MLSTKNRLKSGLSCLLSLLPHKTVIPKNAQTLHTAFAFLKVIKQEVYPFAVPVKPVDICTTDTTQNILRGQVSHSPCPSTVTLHPNYSCPVISQQCLQDPYLFLCPFCSNTCILKSRHCKYTRFNLVIHTIYTLVLSTLN